MITIAKTGLNWKINNFVSLKSYILVTNFWKAWVPILSELVSLVRTNKAPKQLAEVSFICFLFQRWANHVGRRTVNLLFANLYMTAMCYWTLYRNRRGNPRSYVLWDSHSVVYLMTDLWSVVGATAILLIPPLRPSQQGRKPEIEMGLFQTELGVVSKWVEKVLVHKVYDILLLAACSPFRLPDK